MRTDIQEVCGNTPNVMDQKKQLETLEIIQATSKDELYKTLNTKFENYKIVEETKERNFPAFWKSNYKVKVLVPSPVHIQTSNVESFSEKLQSKINRLSPSLLNEMQEERELKEQPEKEKEKFIQTVDKESKQLKKNELLKMLEQGSTVPKETNKIVVKKEEKVSEKEEGKIEINQLKEMLTVIHNKLDDEEPIVSPAIKVIEDILRDNGVEEKYIKYFITKATKEFQSNETVDDTVILDWLIKETETQIRTDTRLKLEDKRIITLVGQTGVGKTTTLVKIGWQLSNKDRSVGFITTDTFRSGAVQQLEGYAEKMGTELIVANGSEELIEAIGYFTYVNQVDHILIDTVGRNYMADDSINVIKEYLEVAQSDVTCLTFSAVSKSNDMLEIISKFKPEEFTGFIFTKLDETKTIGGLFSVFMETKNPVLIVTDGQDVTKNICVPTSELLAKKMYIKDISLSEIYHDE